jgi:hypothetical protein
MDIAEEVELCNLVESLLPIGAPASELDRWVRCHRWRRSNDDACFRLWNVAESLRLKAKVHTQQGRANEAAKLRTEAASFDALVHDEMAAREVMSSLYLWMTYGQGMNTISRYLAEYGVHKSVVLDAMGNDAHALPGELQPHLWVVFLASAYLAGIERIIGEFADRGLSVLNVDALVVD